MVQELAQPDLAWASRDLPAGQLSLHTEGHTVVGRQYNVVMP